jgi:hypothetical protein
VDSALLLWDVARIVKVVPAHPRAADPAAALRKPEREVLWKRLASADASEAADAMVRLREVPADAVALFRARLRPVPPVDATRIARLITDLDDRRFEVRQRATEQLKDLAELAEPALRARLADKPSLETRRRVQRLLKEHDRPVTRPEQARMLRAVELLEHLGAPDALLALGEWTRGAPDARLTREAKAALERLEKGH